MTLQQQQFLELLKSGLWGTPPNLRLFTENVNWKLLYKMASEQAVSGIIADGIENLPQTHFPPKDILKKFIMAKLQIRQVNIKMNSTLNDIVSLLRSRCIRSILLKGQGVAQYYRNPESRSCGDIDLFIGKKNYQESCDILLNSGQVFSNKLDENVLHTSILFNGIEVEIHRQAGYLKNKNKDYRFQTWAEGLLEEDVYDKLPQWSNNGTTIFLPDPTFNAIFLMQHIARHIITEGIGFRQICDWIMFIHRNHHLLNREIIEMKIHELNMEDIWNGFSLLAINFLNLPIEELPVKLLKETSNKTEKLLEEIFTSGNFGHYNSYRRILKKHHYINKRKRNIFIQIIRISKIITIFPKSTICYGFEWIINGLKRLLRH